MRWIAGLAALALPLVGGAEEEALLTAKTGEGRLVVLHENGTWEYADLVRPPASESSLPPAPTPPPAPKPRWAEDALEVWDTSLQLTHGEYGRDSVDLYLHYDNKTAYRVVGVVSRVVITSPLGKVLLKDTFEEEAVVQPNTRIRNDVHWEFEDNQFIRGERYDVLWQVAQNGTAKISAKVLKVVLEDGTVLKARRP